MEKFIKKFFMMPAMALAMFFGFISPAIAQGDIYVLTNQLENGKEYLIVNSNSEGDGYALSNGSTYNSWGTNYADVDKKPVNIIKGTYSGTDYYYIENVDEKSKWNVGGNTDNWTFSKSINNRTYYIKGYDLDIVEGNNSNKWRWNSTNNSLYYYRERIWPLSDQNWYLRYYNNSFSTSQTQNSVYLYKKITRPQITANPSSLSFETIKGISTTNTFKVKGTNLQGDITASVSGTGFSFGGSSTTTTISKSDAQSTNGKEITVTFNPTTAGTSFTGTITLSTSYGQTVTISLTGTAHAPSLTAPESLSIETITGVPTSQTFILKGTDLMEGVTASVTSGSDKFSINPTTISKDYAQSTNGKEITVTFNSTTAGTFNGTVTLTSPGAQTVTVTLTGTAHSPSLAVNPASLSFETITGVPTTQTFTLKGTDLMEGVTASVTGTGFSINPTTISKDEAQSTNGKEITVTFNSTTAGTFNGTVTLTSEGAQTVTVTLTGIAHAPSLTAPESLSFETITGISTTQTFILKGTDLMEGVTASVTGTGFSINPTTISKDDAQNANGKVITVTFNPTTADNFNGTVTLTSAGAQTVTVTLTGNAHDPSLTAPTTLYLETEPEVPVTATFNVSGEYLKSNVTLTYAGDNVISIDNTSITKDDNNKCNGTITVTFAPQERGNHTYSGTVTISADGATPKTVQINATATDVWIDVKISSAGISTFYCDFPVVIPKTPTGLQNVKYPYQIQGNSLQLYDWSDENNHIPANTGTILMGNEGTYRFYKYHGTVNSLPEEYPNLLTGTSTQITRTEALSRAGKTEETAIIMTLAPGKDAYMGFYKFIGKNLAAYKAYLIYEPTAGSNVSYFSLGGGENLDGIRDVKAVGDDDAWYSLQGARLNGKPTQRGIYIHGGKKVAVK